MAWLVSRGALVALALAVLGLNAPAQAQSYPSKTITIVVSIGAGTGMDVLVRLYAEKLSAALGKPVVVENKPGAATMLAANAGRDLAARRPHAGGADQRARWRSIPALYKQINYDPENDFVPISLYVKSPFILVVNPSSAVSRRCRSSSSTPRRRSRRSTTPRSAPAACSTCRWNSPSSGFGFDADPRALPQHRTVGHRPGRGPCRRWASSRPAPRSR